MSTGFTPIRVLLLEDDKVDSLAFQRLVQTEHLPYTYDVSESIQEATNFLKERTYDVVITDFKVPDGTGFDILPLASDIPVIIATGSGNEEIAVQAMRHGASDYLIKDPHNNYLKVLPITIQNAVSRHSAERELARYMAELERSHARLEEFARVVAHELREPLRKIVRFGDEIVKSHRRELSGGAADYFGRMQNAARRMYSLIEELLEYSRIRLQARDFEQVDLNVAVKDVISDLEAVITSKQSEITCGNLPTIEADPLQIRQLFRNLLGNSLKFQDGSHPPVITISATPIPPLPGSSPESTEAWEITVRDNGIGFDQKDAARLFEIFERLHPKHQFEGSGMGLALCRKIVERHGGRIWAEGQPGHGATVTFSLADKQKHATSESRDSRS
jgi:light-regulated signal transduction histidine kinase (bacteriophytochrome)